VIVFIEENFLQEERESFKTKETQSSVTSLPGTKERDKQVAHGANPGMSEELTGCCSNITSCEKSRNFVGSSIISNL
jgi:hypothetical protein